MIFQKDSVEKILNKTKVQTRRLVKEGDIETILDNEIVTVAHRRALGKWRMKWQVGRDYCVSFGRGKPGVLVCTCGACNNWIQPPLPRRFAWGCPITYLKPLRIKITSIRKERLLDISEEDAKKEGFDSVLNFLNIFLQINYGKIPREVLQSIGERVIAEEWNPEVWVLSFEVKK